MCSFSTVSSDFVNERGRLSTVIRKPRPSVEECKYDQLGHSQQPSPQASAQISLLFGSQGCHTDPCQYCMWNRHPMGRSLHSDRKDRAGLVSSQHSGGSWTSILTIRFLEAERRLPGNSGCDPCQGWGRGCPPPITSCTDAVRM